MKLSTGEILRVLRRRAGSTQEEVAARYGATQPMVSMWENDELPFPGLVNPINDLTISERCYLTRRRKGLTINRAAEMMDVSHVTIINWERGNPENKEYLDKLNKSKV